MTQDRETAETRGGELVQAALARRVDRADSPREGAGDGRRQQAYDGGEREREEAVGESGGESMALMAKLAVAPAVLFAALERRSCPACGRLVRAVGIINPWRPT